MWTVRGSHLRKLPVNLTYQHNRERPNVNICHTHDHRQRAAQTNAFSTSRLENFHPCVRNRMCVCVLQYCNKII